MVWLCLLLPSVARKHACTALSVCLVQPLCPLLVDEPGRGAWGLTIYHMGCWGISGGRKWNASPATHWEASSQLPLKGDDIQRTTTASSNRKCSREKEIWETEEDENSQKGTKQHRLTGITVKLPHARACYHLDILELKASTPWSKDIIWVISGW